MAVGTHGEHGAIEIELQDFDVRRRVRNRVGNFADPFFEQLDRFVVIDRVRQLRFQIDAAIGIGGKILDRVRKDFVVADYRQHVVRRVQRGDKKSDFLHRTGNTAHRYEIADLERPEHNHERAGGGIRQQPAPRHADGDTGGSREEIVRGETEHLG